jgi:3-oxoacyl-[acyl-carrier protein] reductase
MNISDLRILVTGAARGMGAHFVRRLAESGARVAAGDIDATGLAELASFTDGLPGSVAVRSLDVADAASVATFVSWAEDEIGPINGLINNAGIIRDALLVKRHRESGEILAMAEDDWRKVLDVNLTGAALMTRDVAGRMLATETRPGIVVNISSISRHGNRGQSSYVAAKAALAANAVTWNRELARHGIRVVAIAPGMVATPMTDGMNQRARAALIEAIPVGRIGDPEDIWRGVRFAIECDYFAGKTLDIDGGLVMS